MGHGSNDKLYITHSEWSGKFGPGQHSANRGASTARPTQAFKRLPFDCCALSLQPFSVPYADRETGTIFDLRNILPYIQKYGTHPRTGKPLLKEDLIPLHFHSGADAEGTAGQKIVQAAETTVGQTSVYHDPITHKPFTEHTHLVALAPTGNVYAMSTLDRLAIRPKLWTDLLTGEPFTRKDIIVLQDPQNLSGRDLSSFDYVKSKKSHILPSSQEKSSIDNINLGAVGGASTILKQLASSTTAPASNLGKAQEAPKERGAWNPSKTNSKTAASLTSTALSISTGAPGENVPDDIDEQELMFDQIMRQAESAKGKDKASKSKAYVRIVTTLGNLNLELHCDKAPKTCFNFMMLAKEGKYDGVIFHRLIPGFMVQGGDPTGTGRGGQSYWGTTFRDEYNNRGAFKHDSRGTLSMANSGPATNGSQFFLSFRATPHLDKKHTVFGRVVGGMEVLDAIERTPTERGTDLPLRPITITTVQLFNDPFEDYLARQSKRRARDAEQATLDASKAAARAEREADRTTWMGTRLGDRKAGVDPSPSEDSSSVGRYLKRAPAQGTGTGRDEVELGDGLIDLNASGEVERRAKRGKTQAGGGFGNFSAW